MRQRDTLHRLLRFILFLSFSFLLFHTFIDFFFLFYFFFLYLNLLIFLLTSEFLSYECFPLHIVYRLFPPLFLLHQEGVQPPAVTVVVRNLPIGTTETELRALCEHVGEVAEVEIPSRTARFTRFIYG